MAHWELFALALGFAINLAAVVAGIWRGVVLVRQAVEDWTVAAQQRRAEDLREIRAKLDHLMRNSHKIYDAVNGGPHNATDETTELGNRPR